MRTEVLPDVRGLPSGGLVQSKLQYLNNKDENHTYI